MMDPYESRKQEMRHYRANTKKKRDEIQSDVEAFLANGGIINNCDPDLSDEDRISFKDALKIAGLRHHQLINANAMGKYNGVSAPPRVGNGDRVYRRKDVEEFARQLKQAKRGKKCAA